MTVKELAEFFGCSEKTIYRASEKAGIAFENGIQKVFTKQEVEELSTVLYAKVPSAIKDAIEYTFPNVQGNTLDKRQGITIGQNDGQNVDPLDAALWDAINAQSRALSIIKSRQDTMIKVYSQEISTLKQKQKLLEAPKPEKMTIKGWVSLNPDLYMNLDRGDYVSLGRKAARLSREQCKDIGHVPDEIYGSIAVYDIDILRQL